MPDLDEQFDLSVIGRGWTRGVLHAVDQVDIAMMARNDQVRHGLGEPAGNPDPEGSLVPSADGYRTTR